MSTTFFKVTGTKQKSHKTELSLTSFYGGDDRGRCIQVTLNPESDTFKANEYIELTRQQVESLRDGLNQWLSVPPKAVQEVPTVRPLRIIARDIQNHWSNVWFGAVPYLDAMKQLDSIHDDYYEDTAESVVRYFLANAQTWKGEDARRIKKELNQMLKKA